MEWLRGVEGIAVDLLEVGDADLLDADLLVDEATLEVDTADLVLVVVGLTVLVTVG